MNRYELDWSLEICEIRCVKTNLCFMEKGNIEVYEAPSAVLFIMAVEEMVCQNQSSQSKPVVEPGGSEELIDEGDLF